jgi:hypothetical protein
MASLLPKFAHQRIILAPENLRYNPCNDLIFPSIVRVREHVPGALGDYYLYYAPHDAPGGVCLAYANAPEGPWTEYGENPIITRQWDPHYEVSHVSSPHALWIPEAKKFYLYYHGENTTTRVASSADGIHFDYEGVAVEANMYDGVREVYYARVFPCPAGGRSRYVLLTTGNNRETRRIYAAWSDDGLKFEPQMKPLASPPPGTQVSQCGAPWYLPHEGRNLVIFHGDITTIDLAVVAGGGGYHTNLGKINELTTNLHAIDVGAHFDEENHLGLFYDRHDVAPDNYRVSDPCFIRHDGALWMATSVGQRLGQRIALAREVR